MTDAALLLRRLADTGDHLVDGAHDVLRLTHVPSKEDGPGPESEGVGDP